jgi:hypothetical protein
MIVFLNIFKWLCLLLFALFTYFLVYDWIDDLHFIVSRADFFCSLKK